MRALVAAALQLVVSTAQAEFVPFVIPATTPQNSLLRQPFKAVSSGAPHLTVKGSHFYDGKRRYRVWGVNVCFAANLPEEAAAPVIADRLAAAGANGVRLHHLDTSQWPRGIWNNKDGKTIEPRALLAKIRHAGAVFLGRYTPEPLSDYYSGTNHVLPTAGTARYASPLGVYDLGKWRSVAEYDRDAVRRVADTVDLLARREHFEAHARAVTIRTERD